MEILEKYEPFLLLLDLERDISPLEAERKAEKCFYVQAMILRDLHAVELKEILLADDTEQVKSELMISVPSEYTNAETRKAWVHSRPRRRSSAERHAASKVDVDFLRRALKLFEGAQIHFSAKAKRG